MSKVQTLRAFVQQRLSAAAEEIFELFERTIAEYEEELCGQRKLLDAVFKPEVRLHRADVQLLLVSKEKVPPEQQEWRPSLDQEDPPEPPNTKEEWSPSLDQEDPPEPPHIKEEQEELWTSQEGEQPQGLENADITKFTFTSVPVKSEEDNEEKPQSSQLHQRLTGNMETEADGEDCGGPEPSRNLDPERHLQPDTEDVTSETREPQSGLNPLQNNSGCITDVQLLLASKAAVPPEQQAWSPSLDQEDPPEPPHIKEEQEELWTSQEGEQLRGLEEADITKFTFTLVPVKSEEDEKPQSSQLHKRLTEANGEDCESPEPVRNSDPDRHLQQDTDKISSETDDSCDWEMSALNSLQNNEVPVSDVECNTGKTSSSSSECATSLDQEGHLQEDNGNQPEKLSSCSVCKKTFQCRKNVARHMKIHTGEKPFSCAVCHKEFGQKEHLRQHMTIHTGEKPFSCSVCGKQFAFKTHLRRHSIVHTGEKPFSCSVCSKGFARSSALTSHLRVHTGEKPFTCSVCKDCEVQQISVQVRSKLYV
ncbi:zinc finger protein 135-like isoform X4 [Micropterus dolomieu]|uniref:zinc finger protein 135-like isoform X4 n=1 Tax=Micropterus dolomieu TaxID=147949 RepID=UPI001E8D3D67|nr:zinc finger protein 135-like isoform X4 [Micropterus dolomieu]